MSKYTDLINPKNNVDNIANSIANGFQSGALESNVALDGDAVRGSIREHGVSRFLRGGDIVGGRLRAKDKIVNGLDDPSSLGFTFIIDQPYLNTGLFGTENFDSATLTISDVGYSALSYLKNCVGAAYEEKEAFNLDDNGDPIVNGTEFVYSDDGFIMGEQNTYSTYKYTNIKPGDMLFVNEYKNMSAFVNGFKTLTREYPYVFQTIDGLPDAYKKYFSNKKDSYLGGGDDNKIKIGCLESMDLRMLSLFDAYFNAVYNHRYRRQIVPPNLLKFNCGILVHDLRNVVPASWSDKPVINKDFAEFISKNVSSVYFRFIDCIFDTDDIGESFANVNNNESSTTNFSFSFVYNNVEIYVNSLADAIENSMAIERNKILDSNRVYDVEVARTNNKRKYFDGEDYNIYFNYNNGMNIGEALMNFGQKVFNSATSTSKFGNVYDESAYGLVSNILSTISGASASSILGTLANQGKKYLGEKIMENIPSGKGKDFLGNIADLPKGNSVGEPVNGYEKNSLRDRGKSPIHNEKIMENLPSNPNMFVKKFE